jgi:uncharacterized membrane protein
MTDEKTSKPRVTGRRRDLVIAADRFIFWLTHHWLGLFNSVMALYVGLPFLAPALMRLDAPGPAGVIYRVYHAMCHQLGFRSWFLFGQASQYPRSLFEQLTGINTATLDGLTQAREFVGDAQLGYKVALCERDIAIYGAVLLGGLLYALVRARAPRLGFAAFAVISVMPIAIDGFSQLLSQPPFNLLPYRESTWYLRTLTGALFGLGLAWLAYPSIDESMQETRAQLSRRFGW